jgi:streptogramin lyase
LNDLERRLKHSLKEVRDAHHASIDPNERFEARRAMLRRLHRRRAINSVGAVALGTAAVVVIAVLATRTQPVGGPDPSKTLPPASQPLEAVSVGRAPSDIAVGGIGNVWTANQENDSVTRVDPRTDRADISIPLSSSPGDIAIASGPVWVALPDEGAVTKVDFLTGQPSETITVSTPGIEMELTVGPDVLWIVAKGDALYRLDAGSATPQRLELTARPVDVAVHGTTGYLLDADGTVTLFDQTTGDAVGNSFTVAPGEAGDLIYAAGALWHFTGADGNLIKMDPSSGAELARYEADGTVIDLAIDPKVAWVLVRAGDGTHRVVRIAREDAAPSGDEITMPGQAVEAGISGGRLWVTDRTGNQVLAFDKLP